MKSIKFTIFGSVLLFVSHMMASAYPIPRPVQPTPTVVFNYAKITKLTQDHGFPVATGRVTFLSRCNSGDPKVELKYLVDQNSPAGGTRAVIVKVKVKKMVPGTVRCAAMPYPQSLTFKMDTRVGPVKLVTGPSGPVNPMPPIPPTPPSEGNVYTKLDTDYRVNMIMLSDLLPRALQEVYRIMRSGRDSLEIKEFLLVEDPRMSTTVQKVRMMLHKRVHTGLGSSHVVPMGYIEVEFVLVMDLGLRIHDMKYVRANLRR